MNEYWRALCEAYQDELRAYEFYNQLARIAPSPELSRILATIAKDEYAHARTLAALMSGMPAPNWHSVTEASEAVSSSTLTFKEGIETALEGELGDMAEYATLAKTANTLELKLIFYSIAGDEYGHARTFMTILVML